MEFLVYIAVSLDGFIAREDGSLDWLPGADPGSKTDAPTGAEPNTGEDYGMSGFLDNLDGLLMGRNTWKVLESFAVDWPYMDGQRKIPVYVWSSQLKQADLPADQPAYAVTGDLRTVVAKLASNNAKRIWLDGGQVIRSFLRAGLVKELVLTRIPVLIGQGIRLFGELEQDIKLELVKSQGFSSGFVQDHYRVVGS